VVKRAVEDAKAGNAKAREWLASYLVGKPETKAVTLFRLAVEAVRGTDPVANVVASEVAREREAAVWAELFPPFPAP